MTKQEEIREGIETRLTSLMILCGEPPQKAKEDAQELVGAWFKWMDSQGVVIKVEGELPLWYKRTLYGETNTVNISKTIRDLYAGFKKVEPLIKES